MLVVVFRIRNKGNRPLMQNHTSDYKTQPTARRGRFVMISIRQNENRIRHIGSCKGTFTCTRLICGYLLAPHLDVWRFNYMFDLNTPLFCLFKNVVFCMRKIFNNLTTEEKS